ncbi:MAG: pantoate--beta-alanine ligase [Myxococcota bacterium]|nr:pantoate--beta-alanine ligase [Myxococcota bacterium]
MVTIERPEDIQNQCLAWRDSGLRVGFVPTMGFLHDGHLSLMRIARQRCDKLVVSIFVNPLQFGPNEDLETYPRDEEGDAEKCASVGVDALFLPNALYPPGHQTRVTVTGLTNVLCGASRPGHFEGVTTVVARLFGLVQPHVAVFGEKDYQQLAVIRRMTRDLALPVEVVGGPLVRDKDGLALSSRNAYLSAADRERALTLHRALDCIADSTAPTVAQRIEEARAMLQVDALDYLEVLDAESLEPLERLDRPARAFVAARVGNTRLIDNKAV